MTVRGTLRPPATRRRETRGGGQRARVTTCPRTASTQDGPWLDGCFSPAAGGAAFPTLNAMTHDVCIIGAGPAGLSAALVLGRCRRKVMVFDSGRPRNAKSRALHAYLTRDGLPPQELRAFGRAELAAYPSVEVRDELVATVARRTDSFAIESLTGSACEARILLLATGRMDVLPTRPGFAELYGRGVYHCPFCDGWEHRDQPLAAYGRGTDAYEVALELLTWSRDVVLCSDGPPELSGEQRRRLAANGIAVLETPIASLRAGGNGELELIHFEGGEQRRCGAVFFISDTPQRSALPEALGCDLDATGAIRCEGSAATNVPGLFVAGNVRCGLHFAITAAAEGAEAAVAINDALLERDLA